MINVPDRSAALGRALADDRQLPDDFASRVATLAETKGSRPRSWSDLGLLGAFLAMLGGCMAAWYGYGAEGWSVGEWLGPVVDTVKSQPWLAMGVSGVVLVQMLTYRRRAAI